MMNCQQLSLSFISTNELQTMRAEKEVEIQQFDDEITNRFTAGSALYTATNGALQLLDNPQWYSGQRHGTGDQILANVRSGEMLVRGNALMELPAEELGRTSQFLPASVATTRTNSFSNEPAKIFAEQYTLTSSNAVFDGKVHIDHPQIAWACPRISVELPPRGGVAGRIVAGPGVVFDLVHQNGQKVHGVGENAVFRRWIQAGVTNALIELSGSPASLQLTNGLVLKNKLLLLDAANGRFFIPQGKYKISGPTNSANTNFLNLDTSQFTRQFQRRK
jgi:lipopolysaccharide export system protein LptA